MLLTDLGCISENNLYTDRQLIQWQIPGFAGGLAKFDFYGIKRNPPPVNCSKWARKRLYMKCPSSLCHTTWDCKYYIVWIQKWRRKIILGKLRSYFGDVFHELARQRESNILEGHLCIEPYICILKFSPSMLCHK